MVSGELQLGPGGEAATLNAAHGVGSVLTFPALAFGNAVAGSTAPELGTNGGFFAGFDKATIEVLAFVGFGMIVPRTWLTFNLYIEARNFTGSPGDVVWRASWNGGADVDTTVSYPDSDQNIVRISTATTYTLDTFTVAGVVQKGGAMKVSRVGDAVADTLDGDIQLAAIHAVRVT